MATCHKKGESRIQGSPGFSYGCFKKTILLVFLRFKACTINPARQLDGTPGVFVSHRHRAELGPALRATLAEIGEHGWDIWAHFDRTVRDHRWHPFVPADYENVLEALVALRAPGLRFLEWGSATGVIAIMADL